MSVPSISKMTALINCITPISDHLAPAVESIEPYQDGGEREKYKLFCL
jgi:hypothetical protein